MFNGMALPVRALRFLAVLLSFMLVLGGLSVARAADDFLDPSVAFKFSASESPGQVDVHFKVANGYYLYRERFAFAVKSGQATLGDPQFPAGHVKFDQTFQKDVETYRDEVVVHVPVKQASGPFELAVTSQVRGRGHLLSAGRARREGRWRRAGRRSSSPSSGDAVAAGSWFDKVTSADFAQSLLEGHGFFTIVALYFVAGVVLSLLPCSYPMIPIVSAIIIGQGTRATHARGFALSLTYVVGMALVYTVLGIAAALVGQSLGAWLQNPWVLGAFGVLLTAFAVSLISGRTSRCPHAGRTARPRHRPRARRSFRRGRGDGRAVRTGCRRMHDGTAVRGARLHRAHGQCAARRRCTVRDGAGAGRAAAGRRRRGRDGTAARRRMDGRREGVLRHRAARSRAVDRVAGAGRWPEDGARCVVAADRGRGARAVHAECRRHVDLASPWPWRGRCARDLGGYAARRRPRADRSGQAAGGAGGTHGCVGRYGGSRRGRCSGRSPRSHRCARAANSTRC